MNDNITERLRHSRRYAAQCLRDEAQALTDLIGQLDESFDQAVEMIYHCRGKVIVTGVGKSGNIGAKIAATLSSTGTPAFYINPLDVYHGDLGVITSDDIVLALSNSGQTDELLRFIPIVLHMNVPIIAMTSNPDSLLAKYGDLKESQLITATKARLLNDSAAVALADSTLRHWTGDTSGYGNQLRNIKMKAEQPILYIRLERKYFHSNEWPWLHIGYNNLERVDVAVYGMANGRQKGKPLWHTTKQLLEDEPWRQSTDSLQLPQVPVLSPVA